MQRLSRVQPVSRPRTLAEQALIDVMQDQEALWMHAREIFFTEVGDASISTDAVWAAMTEDERAPYGQRVIALFQREAATVKTMSSNAGGQRLSIDSPLTFLSG